MKYQLMFHTNDGFYRAYTHDDEFLEFDSQDEAEARAKEVTIFHPSKNVLVVTVHCGFVSNVEYPQPQPIVKMKRFTPGKYGEITEVLA